MSDLIKDQQTHVIGLKSIKRRLGQMEEAIVQYFISRNEDQQLIVRPPALPPRRNNRRPRRRPGRIRTRQGFLPGLVIPGGGIY